MGIIDKSGVDDMGNQQLFWTEMSAREMDYFEIKQIIHHLITERGKAVKMLNIAATHSA